MKSLVNKFIEFDIQKFNIIFLKIVLIFSAYLNYSSSYAQLLHNPDYFHYPFMQFFAHDFVQLDRLLINCSLFSCVLLISTNSRIYSIPFLLIGAINLYIVFSDLMAIHHDMLFSGIVFILLGIIFLNRDIRFDKILFQMLIGYVAVTYLLAGIAKIDSDFLSGEAAIMIMERASGFPWSPIYAYILPFVGLLAYYSMIVEILEPFILSFLNSSIKAVSVVFTFPFHLGILLTGTGLIYNSLYPAIFLFIGFYKNPKINNSVLLTCKLGAIFYCSIVLILLIKVSTAL